MSDDEDFRDDDPPDHERTLRVLLVTDGESRLIRSSAVCERCGHLSVFHVESYADGWRGIQCLVPGRNHFAMFPPRDVPNLRNVLARKRPWWRFW